MCNKIRLSPDAKLRALRACDPYREWNSLDDKRVCILCQKHITGRQIEVVRRRGRSFKAHCPTVNCPSTFREWVYPGNPYTSEKAWHDWQRAIDEEASALPHRDGTHRAAA